MARLFVFVCLAASVVLTHRGDPAPQGVVVSASRAQPRPASSPGRAPSEGRGTPRPLPAVPTVPPVPEARPAADPRPTCTASWYGHELAGRPTASGEPFDPSALTAASWDHPFGTVLEVTAVATGRTVRVRVNDRGPARRLGRCIDLSRAAYARLAALSTGLLEVTVQEVPVP